MLLRMCCRFLQRKFDEGGPQAVGRVLPEILGHLMELMVDPFGNYLIQKLLDRCDEAQRLQVWCTEERSLCPGCHAFHWLVPISNARKLRQADILSTDALSKHLAAGATACE